MRDPYLYEKSHVLKNKLNIRTQEELDDAEADYVVYRLREAILQSRKLGRPLTESEMKQFEVN